MSQQKCAPSHFILFFIFILSFRYIDLVFQVANEVRVCECDDFIYGEIGCHTER